MQEDRVQYEVYAQLASVMRTMCFGGEGYERLGLAND